VKRFLFLVLFSSFLLGQSPPQESPPQKPPFELEPVDRLKATAVAHFDPTLSLVNFGRWFRRLVHPSVPNYEFRDCDTATAPQPAAAPKPQCAFVTALLPQGRVVSLQFTFDAEHKSFDYAEGSIGPSDPRSKQPTKLIKKLGELPALVHPEGAVISGKRYSLIQPFINAASCGIHSLARKELS